MPFVDVPSRPLLLAGRNGEKHYQLKTYHLRRLVTHVEKGGALESHKGVPEAIREEQQKLEKDKRKGGRTLGTGAPYPPIDINALLSQPSTGLDNSAAKAEADSKGMRPLEIPGPRGRQGIRRAAGVKCH